MSNQQALEDWLILSPPHSGLSCFVLLVVTSSVASPPTITPLFSLYDCLFFFLCPTCVSVRWFRRHHSRGEVPSTRCSRLCSTSFELSARLSVAVSACICTACVLAAQKIPLCRITLDYFNLPGSFSRSNALWYLLTFKQPSMHSFFLYMPLLLYASGWSHVSLNHSCSCSSQGPGTLFSRTRTSRRVPQSVLFTPKHSLTDIQHSKKHTTP